MNINIDNHSVLTLILAIICFGIGYILGTLSKHSGVSNISPKSFFVKESDQPKQTIAIDDRKYVTDIKTSGLEKKYDNLGDVKNTNENITSSVDKLKNLKR